MDKQQEQLETLREIRTLMERSSRFLSLSGLSGVIAGITAIAGIVVAYLYLGISPTESGYYELAVTSTGETNTSFYAFFLIDLTVVLVIALLGASLLSRNNAKKEGKPVWDIVTRRLLVNMAIPLVAGGIYCLILLYHNHIEFIAPATLIFYGMGLLNASKYTFNDIRYLGVLEIATGLIASLVPEFGLLFWVFGFGILHIVYGITVYYKYEK